MAQRKSSRRKKQKLTISQAVLMTVVLVAVAMALFKYEMPEVQPVANSVSSAVVTEPTGQVQTRIHTIDVGQGDATLIQQNGINCLIDAGTKSSADMLVEYLRLQGVEKLDLVIMTHAHADHIGGMPQVLAAFSVDRFILPDFSLSSVPTTAIFRKTLEGLEAQPDCAVETVQLGSVFALDNATLTVVGAGIKCEGQNDTSICTLFEAPGVRYLNTGDAEKSYEQQLVQNGYDLRADIFKAGHHGSSTSNTAALLSAAAPRYIAISCGAGNDYGHPHQEAMDRFIGTGADLRRTDESGSIVYTVSDGVLEVK